jgi:hypothetical protein
VIREVSRIALAGGLTLTTISLVVKPGAVSTLPRCINKAICDKCSIFSSCERDEAIAERQKRQEAPYG